MQEDVDGSEDAESLHSSRRGFLRTVALLGGGAVFGGAIASGSDAAFGSSPARSPSGPATLADPRAHPRHGRVGVNWNVDTEKKLIALTFDDGPLPDWTPMVHDALDAADVPATFFFVGRRLEAHGDLIRNRMGRHEAGNHTWAHVDLSTLADDEALDAVRRTHDVIDKVLGQQAHHLRPPYGHLGGSTLLAAAELGYDITLWSLQMLEWEYVSNPAAHVAYIVGAALPGTILLAHDVGPPSRLVALNHLPEIVAGLRAKGFTFVTVSGLLNEQRQPPAALISDHALR